MGEAKRAAQEATPWMLGRLGPLQAVEREETLEKRQETVGTASHNAPTLQKAVKRSWNRLLGRSDLHNVARKL